MDNQKLLTRRNIFIVLGVVIAAEVLWASLALFQTNRQIGETPPVATKPQPTQIELQTDKTAVKVGEQFTVSVYVLSDKLTDGVDLIINYDPQLLSASPFILGSLYNEYPFSTIDSKEGKITVSGIATSTDGVKPNGLFGSIVFNAQAAGQAAISLEFTPASTVDTNVIEKGTGEDILESVKNLTISINP